MNLKELGEFGLIDRIKKIIDAPSADLIVGVGDDAAAYRTTTELLTLITTDALIEGIHFELEYFTFRQLGWRALAANLSDIAAMGGRPKYAVLSLGLPEKIGVESVEEFYYGANELCNKFQTVIVGGDTTRSPDRLFVSVTVIGEVEEEKLTRRTGARAGDAVFVTGTLGGAQAGLKLLKSRDSKLKEKYCELISKHCTPQPQVSEAGFLVENFPIHSMIDISDGLASEINHICKQSGVGALLNAGDIPIDSATREAAAAFEEIALNYALKGGEDFVLLFTAPEVIADGLQNKFRGKFGYECARIGKIKHREEGVNLQFSTGKQVPISADSYDHFGK